MSTRRVSTGIEMHVQEGGNPDGPLLVMLHGIAANGDAWHRFLPYVEKNWRGRWMIPDFRGHGRSSHAKPYALGIYAADIAALVGWQDVYLVGHSMGGAVSMILASNWFGTSVKGVVAFGIKMSWTPEEMAMREKLSKAPVRWFDTQGEAVERFLKVSGMFGLVDPTSPQALGGVREENGKFRLASDTGINNVHSPDVGTIFAAMQVKPVIGVGEKDPMVSVSDARMLDPNPTIVPGTGHNSHVERPDVIWDMVAKAFASA